MGKPCPARRGSRVIARVGPGHGQKQAAAHVRVSTTGAGEGSSQSPARDGPIAPRTRGGAMARKGFVTCIARERAPAVRPWQIVAPGILPFRETGPAIRLLRAPAKEVPAFRSGSRCGRHLFQHPAEPCRDGNHKTGNPETENHSLTLRRFLQAGLRSLRPVAAEETPKPLRRRRLWSGMRATRYSAPGRGMSPNPAMVQS